MSHKHSVVFLCLGNICRSTLSEGIFLSLLKERGLENEWKVDSAGTGAYHIGGPPDERTMETLAKHGINDYEHKARQLKQSDFTQFDYILAMDNSNLRNAKQITPNSATANLCLFKSFDKSATREEVQDPYYCNGRDAFEAIYDECYNACKCFLDHVYAKEVKEQ